MSEINDNGDENIEVSQAQESFIKDEAVFLYRDMSAESLDKAKIFVNDLRLNNKNIYENAIKKYTLENELKTKLGEERWGTLINDALRTKIEIDLESDRDEYSQSGLGKLFSFLKNKIQPDVECSSWTTALDKIKGNHWYVEAETWPKLRDWGNMAIELKSDLRNLSSEEPKKIIF